MLNKVFFSMANSFLQVGIAYGDILDELLGIFLYKSKADRVSNETVFFCTD